MPSGSALRQLRPEIGHRKSTTLRQFVFYNNTLTALHESDKASLEKTIKKFVKILTEEQRNCRNDGIKNINYALVNIQMSYYSIFKESLRTAGEWYENECRIWREVIERALNKKPGFITCI